LPELLAELDGTPALYGDLAVQAGDVRGYVPGHAAWARNIWYEVQEFEIASIADGAKKLRAIQRNWSLYSHQLHGRARLIQDALPKVSAKPLRFPEPAPLAPLGSWTLLAPDRILCASRCSSAFPNGEVQFIEDKSGPPNRAYLKLWEALTVARAYPRPGELCLDLGAAPGGWSWVLAGLGARVIAVDKAPLAPGLHSWALIEQRRMSAFALAPETIGPVDWLFSDIVCYPGRLLGLLRNWIASGLARNIVATVKFQGTTDHAAAREFAGIPGARLLHLWHNKHELTFLRLESALSVPG
jgi:23S rRNA (cytidine2498-2'-O)-methyltransferase